MSELALKYQLLEPVRKQELLDFLDFLLLKQRKEKKSLDKSYEENLLSISVWSEEDIDELENSIKEMDKWQVPEW